MLNYEVSHIPKQVKWVNNLLEYIIENFRTRRYVSDSFALMDFIAFHIENKILIF